MKINIYRTTTTADIREKFFFFFFFERCHQLNEENNSLYNTSESQSEEMLCSNKLKQRFSSGQK